MLHREIRRVLRTKIVKQILEITKICIIFAAFMTKVMWKNPKSENHEFLLYANQLNC